MRASHQKSRTQTQQQHHTCTLVHTHTHTHHFVSSLQTTAHLLDSLFSTTSHSSPPPTGSLGPKPPARVSDPQGHGPAHPGSPDPRPHRVARVIRSKQRTSGIQTRPNLIFMSKTKKKKKNKELARCCCCCYTELVLEGNCIDILLLACLHKLYIWHGGDQTQPLNQKPKTKENITDNVHHSLSNVSTCEDKTRIINFHGGMS